MFVGSSLGLSYSEGAPGHEMFHETLMEPAAYRHFVRTGDFADGTQLVLLLHGAAESVLPGRHGRYAAEIHGVEMAVKDLDRFEEGWAYFGFGGSDGIRTTAEAFPKDSCHDCHAEHAARDNVFVQFYPMLTEAAGVEVAARRPGDDSDTVVVLAAGPMEAGAAGPMEAGAAGESAEVMPAGSPAGDAPPTGEPIVAYGGLDPVMLVAGREEMGKAEIIEEHHGWQYRFASEPNRVTFAADPSRFAPQNETCPVVPGAAIEADLYTVHDGKVYAFASDSCREDFEADPVAYLPPDEKGSR